jgi:hypothetical protein
MQVDFSSIDDVESYISIPEGTYVSRVSEVRTSLTRDGSPRWALRLEVVTGEFAGRTAGWDGLVWSDRGLPRVKTVLQCLGFDVSGHLNIDPEDLVGRQVSAEFIPEEREDPETGRTISRLVVPYMGYQSVMNEDSPF